MPLKRKIRNLPDTNAQMSFFDPVYSNENDLLADGIPRPSIIERRIDNESNETLDTDTITNNDQDQPSELISTSKILIRIKQIQNSIEQAQTMLDSMDKFQHLVPETDGQREKLLSILTNLEEQQASYANLLNLIRTTEEERSVLLNKSSTHDENDDDDDDDDHKNDLSLRRNVEFSTRRSHISSDNEQTNRNDTSNYDSLIGSLKSDTITWREQQSTSADDESDGELEKNLMLQKEQLRALQGQKRALLALQRRSEKRLIEQQGLNKKQPANNENNLLSDINHLRDRLKLIRNLYEQKYENEIQQLNSSSIPTENRLKNLEHIRERLDELEQIVAYYQQDEEITTVYEENILPPDDVQHLKTLLEQKSNENPSQHIDELNAKRLELEQAKSALNQLQQMVKTIQTDESPKSKTDSASRRSEKPNSVDEKMSAQHREIERLIESRQRLHTIKDQIASLHQSMTTEDQTKTYEQNLNDSKNLRPRIKQSNLCVPDRETDDLNSEMREICRCFSTFIEEQKDFNRHIEERLTNSSTSQSTDPTMNQLQQQVLTQSLIVNLNTAYREIALLQSEINALQSENNRLASSLTFDEQYHQQQNPYLHSAKYSRESIYGSDDTKLNIRPKPRSKFDDEQFKQQNQIFETSFNSQSTGKQTAIHLNDIKRETTPTQQQQRNVKHSDTHVLPNDHRYSSEENLSKAFAIRRRPRIADDEQQLNQFSTTEDFENIDIQTLDLQVKSIMVQLIPFMRIHINEIFNQSNLNHIRERVLFLFKQQPDSAQLIQHFRTQFSDLLGKTIEKYCGTTIRDSAVDLIRDISDVAFNQLVKFKIYEKTNESTIKETAIIDNDESDSDKENEFECAVPRQNPPHHTISSEFNSNGHEYIFINGIKTEPEN